MSHLFIDIETYSRLDLTQVGAYRYAEDCEVILAGWAVDDGPVAVSEDHTELLKAMARHSGRIVAHNANFERAVLTPLYESSGDEALPVSRWYCTMAQALAHSLPGSLDALGRFLGLPEDQRKLADGKALIKLFCMPQRGGTRLTAADRPEEWARFREYQRLDVEAMRECFHRMPTVNYPAADDRELRYWHLDQRINDRGFLVDQQLCHGAIEACAGEKKHLDDAVKRITGGALRSATQREALQKWLAVECGVYLEDMRAKTIENAVAAGGVDDTALELLSARRDVSRSSTAKYKRVLEAVNRDGRLRGGTQFNGASRTGRSTGRIFQPLNLPRPNKAQAAQVPEAVEALRHGCADLLYWDVHDKAVYALRGVVIAPRGRRLAVCDWNAIEGRLLSWHAGEAWKVRAYSQGEDCYKLTYRRGWGLKDDAEVSDDKRQHGKVMDLSMGYEGGVSAALQMVPNYGIDPADLGEGAWNAASEDTRDRAEWLWEFAVSRGATHDLPHDLYVKLECAKLLWRGAHPATVQFWRDLKEAAMEAVRAPGSVHRVRRCSLTCRANMLALRLPSGRMILYAAPRIRDEEMEDEDGNVRVSQALTYKAPYGGRDYLYGGKLANAATQGLARDIMWKAIERADAAGFDVVLHVYDEIVAEVDEDSELDHEKLGELMCQPYDFCPGLPLVAEGFTTVTEGRYRK